MIFNLSFFAGIFQWYGINDAFYLFLDMYKLKYVTPNIELYCKTKVKGEKRADTISARDIKERGK